MPKENKIAETPEEEMKAKQRWLTAGENSSRRKDGNDKGKAPMIDEEDNEIGARKRRLDKDRVLVLQIVLPKIGTEIVRNFKNFYFYIYSAIFILLDWSMNLKNDKKIFFGFG